MKKRQKKNKNFNASQESFYFDDFLETNQKQKSVKINKSTSNAKIRKSTHL